MLRTITIANFKKIEKISFSLAKTSVLIGPNNSGKSTVFQALSLWEIGVKKYLSAYQKNDLDRQGAVTLNRQDLLNSPISDTRFLWKNKKVTARNENGKGQTHIPLFVELEGESDGVDWSCKVEFFFSNAESFSCKITSGIQEIKELYDNEKGIHFGFLQPMSGISTTEDKLTQGSIDRKLGEGRTAEVLRNICYEILYPEVVDSRFARIENNWIRLCSIVKRMFGVSLRKPEFIKATGLISLEYDENGITYDISSGGRGFQQTLLLFAYMFANPNTILLLDEPDAHLEVIRQREAFQQINEVAEETNAQILIVSHSEVVLDEAAEASKVIALIENRTFELNTATNAQSLRYIKKSLNEIGWEKYYLSKSKGHVLYLEGSTDLQMLLMFASKMHHRVEPLLRFANVQYTSNNVPNTAVKNFVSLKTIFPELKGLAVFDKIEKNISENGPLKVVCWERRELENYFARPYLLLKHARLLHNKFTNFSANQLEEAMKMAIQNYTLPIYLNDLTHDWWNEAKLSDEWLGAVFSEFYKQIGKPIDFYKRDYYQLIALMDVSDISTEIADVLDVIYDLLKNNK